MDFACLVRLSICFIPSGRIYQPWTTTGFALYYPKDIPGFEFKTIPSLSELQVANSLEYAIGHHDTGTTAFHHFGHLLYDYRT